MAFSRTNPSPEYSSLIAQYQTLHKQGDPSRGIAPEKLYPGNSLPAHADRIKSLVEAASAKSILDYGCGKGLQYQWTNIKLASGKTAQNLQSFWNLDSIHLYDPAVPSFSTLPKTRFDGVISTDVLEHCPPQDVDWILEEIFSFARRFVFMNIACHKAKAHLPDGQNAHRTAMPPAWWTPKIRALGAKFPELKYSVVLERKIGIWKLKHRFRTIVSNL